MRDIMLLSPAARRRYQEDRASLLAARREAIVSATDAEFAALPPLSEVLDVLYATARAADAPPRTAA